LPLESGEYAILWLLICHSKVAHLRLVICSQMIYNSIITKTHRISVKIFLDKSENDAKIVNRTNVCHERRKPMNKTEIIEALDKLSDEKLDMFLNYLRDISDNEQLQRFSPQAAQKVS
jgi:hypothetical protein